MYWNNLREKLLDTLPIDQTKSLENQLNQIEETFRNPNLLIESIKEMQQKQEESLNGIRFKLKEMTKIKENLNITNEFRPNFSHQDASK